MADPRPCFTADLLQKDGAMAVSQQSSFLQPIRHQDELLAGHTQAFQVLPRMPLCSGL